MFSKYPADAVVDLVPHPPGPFHDPVVGILAPLMVIGRSAMVLECRIVGVDLDEQEQRGIVLLLMDVEPVTARFGVQTNPRMAQNALPERLDDVWAHAQMRGMKDRHSGHLDDGLRPANPIQRRSAASRGAAAQSRQRR